MEKCGKSWFRPVGRETHYNESRVSPRGGGMQLPCRQTVEAHESNVAPSTSDGSRPEHLVLEEGRAQKCVTDGFRTLDRWVGFRSPT